MHRFKTVRIACTPSVAVGQTVTIGAREWLIVEIIEAGTYPVVVVERT